MAYNKNVPSRLKTEMGTLDSDIMVCKTVITIFKIFQGTRSNSPIRQKMIKYFNDCIAKNKQLNSECIRNKRREYAQNSKATA